MNRPLETISLTVNGTTHTVAAAPGRRLSDVLREDLRLFGTKVGCDAGDCGACTVLLNGAAVCGCLTPVSHAEGARIETVEGLSTSDPGPLQRAFLRHGAAQCGICSPGMLMAATALLRDTPGPTRAQVETALGGVLCRCTGYAKIIDAVLDVAADRPAPAMPDVGHAVGARLERLDGAPKVLGTEIYGADHVPPGTLEVRAIRSPHHAATFSIGDTAAWSGKASAQVFTAADIPGENCYGTIPAFADQPALAESRVRQRGEAIAIVVADRATMDGLDLDGFPVTWAPEPASIDLDTEPARPLHDNRPDNLLIRGFVQTGDADAALATATHTASLEFETAYVEHACVEPEAGIAWLDGDTLCIQACTQAPVMDRDDCARVLGLPQTAVRIIPAAAGGGFGAKLDLSLQPLIGLAALKTGRPCRMVYTRAESMATTTKRHPARMRARIGCDADGRVAAMTFDGDFNTGAYASWGPTVAIRIPVHASGPFRTPNYRAKARAMHSNGPTSGAFRGFGVPQAAIVQEILYDDLAGAAGLDRLEFRRLNALRDGDRTVCGQKLRGAGIVECLDALRAPWARALAGAGAFNAAAGTVRRGVGVATCWYGCGNTGLPNPSTVRIGLTARGALVLHQGAADVGQGANTAITQIAADALGLPVAQFTLVGPDTALTPDCGKTSASRQTFVTGKAAMLAGQALRRTILSQTNMGDGAALHLDGTRLIVSEGQGRHEIGLCTLPIAENGYVLSAEQTYDPPTRGLDENGQGEPYAVYGYGAHVAELEVDTALGTTRVHRITAAHDLGRVVNPLLSEGQVEGGVAQGLGMALMEEYFAGRTENLHDYLIPTTGDMPRIDTILIEKPDPEGPMGVKGLGEHVLIPTAPAILNAIRHATGARITRLPALPHRVLAAIRASHGT